MRRLPTSLTVLTALVILLIADPPAASAEDKGPAEGNRRIEIKPLKFKVDIPSHWQLTLNERAKRFLTVQETDENGTLQPGSLNIQYTPAKDKPFDQITDAEAYEKIVKMGMSRSFKDYKLVKAELVEIDGYKGACVSFTATTKGIPLRMDSYRVVQPDGKAAFIITCGTTTKLWDDIAASMGKIVSSIQFDAEAE